MAQFIKKIKENAFWGKLLKNSFFAFFGDSVASVINLAVVILMIRMMGSRGYGYLVLAQTYTQIIDALVNIQSWKSIIQYGQKAIIEGDISRLHGYVKLGTVLDISTAILGTVVSLLFIPLIARVFAWDGEMTQSCYILSFVICFHFSGTPSGVLRLLNQFSYVAWQKILTSIIKCLSLFCLWLCFGELTLPAMTVVYAVTDIAGHMLLTLFALIAYHKRYGVGNIVKAKLPKGSKQFVRFTIWTTLSDVVDIPVNYFDVVILSFLSVEMTAIFKVFKQIVSILSKISTPIYQAILPQFSELSVKGRLQEGYYIVKKMRNAILAVMVPLSVLLGVSSRLWLVPFYGEEYAGYWYILTLYLLAQSAALSCSAIHPYFVSLGRVKESTCYVLAANIAYVLFAAFTVNAAGMLGIVGAFMLQYATVILLKDRKIKKILKEGERHVV